MGYEDSDDDETTYHLVKRGDTLSKLAKQYYDDASLYMVIFEANTDLLSDPNEIEVGQQLLIPDLEEDEDDDEEDDDEEYEDEDEDEDDEEDEDEDEDEDDEEVAGAYHVVQRGETLSQIAKDYYGDAKLYTVIFEANTDVLSDPNKIKAGQELFIPELDESEGCSS